MNILKDYTKLKEDYKKLINEINIEDKDNAKLILFLEKENISLYEQLAEERRSKFASLYVKMFMLASEEERKILMNLKTKALIELGLIK